MFDFAYPIRAMHDCEFQLFYKKHPANRGTALGDIGHVYYWICLSDPLSGQLQLILILRGWNSRTRDFRLALLTKFNWDLFYNFTWVPRPANCSNGTCTFMLGVRQRPAGKHRYNDVLSWFTMGIQDLPGPRKLHNRIITLASCIMSRRD